MKKVLLILFIVSQIICANTLPKQSEYVHTHVHELENKSIHLHQHAHLEIVLTLFFQVQKTVDTNVLAFGEIYNDIKLYVNINSPTIFRPPIS